MQLKPQSEAQWKRKCKPTKRRNNWNGVGNKWLNWNYKRLTVMRIKQLHWVHQNWIIWIQEFRLLGKCYSFWYSNSSRQLCLLISTPLCLSERFQSCISFRSVTVPYNRDVFWSTEIQFCYFRCKKHGVPIDKIYNKTQRDKFRWAIDMATEDYHF